MHVDTAPGAQEEECADTCVTTCACPLHRLSLQSSLSAQLYKDCLFLAKFMGRRVSGPPPSCPNWAHHHQLAALLNVCGELGCIHAKLLPICPLPAPSPSTLQSWARRCASQQGNEQVLMNQVRVQFKANMHEVEDDKVGGGWGGGARTYLAARRTGEQL